MQGILGIGTDIVSNSRMAKIIAGTTKARFLQKVLHPKEIEEFHAKPTSETQAEYLASRWALKEAIVKASGRRELIFPEMYLSRTVSAPKPVLQLEGSASQILRGELAVKDVHVSISHEAEYSVAFVLLTL